MAWEDEIQEAAYTSPSGKRLIFTFDSNLSKKTPLKTAEHNFPDVDGAEIQSLGLGGKKFPITAIFSGADHLSSANEFEDALCERGFGVLEHPIYGKHNVVPTGEISRVNDLVASVNESRVTITFSETIVSEMPESELAASDELDEAMSAYEDAAAESFEKLIETDKIEDAIELQSDLKKQTDSLFKGVTALAEKTKNLKDKAKLLQTIQNFKSNINKWISKADEIAKHAQEIAVSVIKIARLPSEIATNVLAKIEGYSSLINDIVKNVKKDPVGANAVKNQYAATSTMLGALVSSLGFGVAQSAQSATEARQGGNIANNNGILSRSDVFEIADNLTEQFEIYKDYTDSQIKKNTFVDTGEAYEALFKSVQSSVQVLQKAAFNLPMTRIMKLGKDRQIYELLCELYGKEGFDRVDEFIMDNQLTADEIVLIPMGREVRYYD